MASQKVEICLKKKNPPRAQIFRYFRIESRNKKKCSDNDSCCGRDAWTPPLTITTNHDYRMLSVEDCFRQALDAIKRNNENKTARIRAKP